MPIALKEYKTLAEFYISGGNRDILYPPPLHLEKLTNIKELSLWSFCNLEKLEPMPHIETLNIVIKKPYDDVQIISNIFPNLKRMEIWGSHLKSGELPPEIGNFKNLEHLELVSCGLTNLPSEFKKLKNLKFLRMGGLAMKIFPEVLCELGQLEELTRIIHWGFGNYSGVFTVIFQKSENFMSYPQKRPWIGQNRQNYFNSGRTIGP